MRLLVAVLVSLFLTSAVFAETEMFYSETKGFSGIANIEESKVSFSVTNQGRKPIDFTDAQYYAISENDTEYYLPLSETLTRSMVNPKDIHLAECRKYPIDNVEIKELYILLVDDRKIRFKK